MKEEVYYLNDITAEKLLLKNVQEKLMIKTVKPY